MRFKNDITFLIAVIFLICVLSACNSFLAHNISFVVDGEVVHTIKTKGNEKVVFPDNPVKAGYIFDGWFLDNEVW